MRPKRFLPSWLAAAGLALPAALPSTRAGTLYWDGTSTGPDADGGNGTWGTVNPAANWDTTATAGTSVPWTNDSHAVFGGTGGAVGIRSFYPNFISASSLTFLSPGYSLSGGLSLTGTPVIATGPHDVTLAASISGDSGVPISKTGTGTLTLSSESSFSGPFNITEGTVKVGNRAAFGTSTQTVETFISPGATLDLNGTSFTTESFGVSGTGIGGAGAIVNNHAATTAAVRFIHLSGPTTIGGTRRWNVTAQSPGSVLNMGGNTLTKIGPNDVHLAAPVLAPGNIDIKEGGLWLALPATGPIPGSAANVITVRSGALFGQSSDHIFPNLWTLAFEPDSTWRAASASGGVGGSSPRWDGPVTLAGTTTLDVKDTIILRTGAASFVSGPGSITKTGDGTWDVRSSNSYSGGTIVDGGKLVLAAHDLATGGGAIRGPVTLNPGTTLILDMAGALGTAPGLRITPLNVNSALVETKAFGANSLDVVNLSAGTLRSHRGWASPLAYEYFEMAAGGSVNVLPAAVSSVIEGRLDLNSTPVTFSVGDGTAAEDLRVAAGLTGTAPAVALVKTGPGIMVLEGPAVFTGGTTIQSGTLLLEKEGSLAASPVSVADGGRFGTRPTGKSFASLSVAGGGGLILPARQDATTVIEGELSLSAGTIPVSPLLGATAPGVYDLATAGSITGTGTPVLDLAGASGPTRATGSIAVNGNKLQLTLTSAGGNLVWNNATAAGAATGNWDITLANFSLGGNDTPFQAFDSVTFDDSVAPGSDKTIALSGELAPALITVDNSNGAYTFTGTEALTGVGSLVKTGSSTLKFPESGYGLTGDITVCGGAVDFSYASLVVDKLTLSGGAFNGASATCQTLDLRSGSSSAHLTTKGPWTKTTAGTVELSSNNSLNTPGSILEGPLIVGNSANPGGGGYLGSGPVHIAAGASMTFVRTGGIDISHPFSGSGSIVLDCVATPLSTQQFTLTGNNNGFSGTIGVVNGRLIGTPAGLGNAQVVLSGTGNLFLDRRVIPNTVRFNTLTAGSNGASGVTLEQSTLSGPVHLSPSGVSRFFVTNTAAVSSPSGSVISGPLQDSGGPSEVAFVGTSYLPLTVSGNHTYTGATRIASGALLDLAGSLGATAVTVLEGGMLTGNGSIGTGGSLTFDWNSLLKPKASGEALTVNGNVDLGTRTLLDVDFSVPPAAGPFPILRYTGTLTGSAASFATSSLTPLRQRVIAISPGLITLDIGSKALVWKGASSDVWRTGTNQNWNTNGTGETDRYYDGDSVTFNDTAATGSVSMTAALQPASVLFDNSTLEYLCLAGFKGAMPLTKRGAGKVTLFSACLHSGGTSIEAGTLHSNVTNTLGTGPVYVSAGATLTGRPQFPGAFQCAGILDPGLSGTPTTPYTISTGPAVFTGTFRCQLSTSASDTLAVKGDLDLTGSTLELTRSFSGTSHPAIFTVATYTGNLTGTFATVTGLPAGFQILHDAPNKRFTVSRLPFSGWITGYPGLSDTTPDGDPDADGLANLLEYVLGGNPASGEAPPLQSQELAGDNFIVRFKRSDSSLFDTWLTVQWGSTLDGPWTDVPVTAATSENIIVTQNGDLPDDITVTLPRQPGQMFVRLKVIEK